MNGLDTHQDTIDCYYDPDIKIHHIDDPISRRVSVTATMVTYVYRCDGEYTFEYAYASMYADVSIPKGVIRDQLESYLAEYLLKHYRNPARLPLKIDPAVTVLRMSVPMATANPCSEILLGEIKPGAVFYDK